MFAEGQAGGRRRRDHRPGPRRADEHLRRHGICYLEFGDDQVGKVEVTFLSGQAPTGSLAGPSVAVAAEKSDFGALRARRWFGRTWTTN